MKALRKITIGTILLATAGLLVAGGMNAAWTAQQGSYTTPDNLFNTVKPAMDDPQMAFTTLRKAIVYAGLSGTLDGQGPATIFAPDDRAFAALPSDQLNALITNKAKLATVLKYHVVLGHAYKVGQLPGLKSAKSLQGADLTFTVTSQAPSSKTISGNRGVLQPVGGKFYQVNGADIIWADIQIANGRIVHAIDKVLMPPM